MAWYRCGGATLSALAKKEVGNRLRTYCGNTFVLQVRFVERISDNIDGVGSSTTSTINVTSYNGFTQLENFSKAMLSDFSGISSFLSTEPTHENDHSSPYYNRWGILWRKTSGSTNAAGQPVADNPGYNGTVTFDAFSLTVPNAVSNLSGFDLKVREQFKSIVGTGGTYSVTLTNGRERKAITFNIPACLPELFESAGYRVVLPSNRSENANGQYNQFQEETLSLLQATYIG